MARTKQTARKSTGSPFPRGMIKCNVKGSSSSSSRSQPTQQPVSKLKKNQLAVNGSQRKVAPKPKYVKPENPRSEPPLTRAQARKANAPPPELIVLDRDDDKSNNSDEEKDENQNVKRKARPRDENKEGRSGKDKKRRG